MVGHYTMFHRGVVINYAGGIETVAADLQELRPTVVASVPRLYEKMYARIVERAVAGGRARRRIFFWAKRHGERWADLHIAKRPIPPGVALRKRIADVLVFRKIKAGLGGRLHFFVSGGAPLSPDLARFFYAAGVPILEGYGLTETSPVMAVNTFEEMRIGTVGRPIPGVEVKIAPDGEIVTRGPNVMLGYYGKPEATAEVLDADGWFHTGDIGLLDADGYLKITDRKKDIIVTAAGKNIAPQPIESLVKKSRFVTSAVMLGDQRKFAILLVAPDMQNLRAWAAGRKLGFTDDASLLALPEVKAHMEREVRKPLRDLAQFEMPKKVLLLEHDFSMERGEMTPTLKVKRRVVERNYREQIEALYAEPAPAGVGHDG
jgi:long-chain acyl-CoA synthetase